MHKIILAIILPLFLTGCAEEKEPLENSFNIAFVTLIVWHKIYDSGIE